MSFEPEAIRAFEHAGWQRAASTYGNSFARATAPYIAPLRADQAISLRLRVHAALPPMA